MREFWLRCATLCTTPRLVALALAVGFFGLSGHSEGTLNAGAGLTTSRPIAVSGTARVIDGDTIEVDGQRVRLEGIDAPEHAQTCPRRYFGTWRCGRSARRALDNKIDGKVISCVSHGRDKYGRMLGVCFADGEDVNAWMVRQGYAWAFVKYSRRYVDDEAKARIKRSGVWTSNKTERAWDYRARRWQVSTQTAPRGCPIKGNISKRGTRIYHAPWSAWYEKVQIDVERGERWFCSEADAQSAGWRAAHSHSQS